MNVTLSGERVGTLFLQSDMQRWNARARQYASILGIFVLISGGLAWLVSSKLQILVSGPILHIGTDDESRVRRPELRCSSG